MLYAFCLSKRSEISTRLSCSTWQHVMRQLTDKILESAWRPPPHQSWDVMFQQDSLGFEMCSQVILVLCNRFGEFLLSLYIPRCVGLLLQFRPSVFEFVLGAKHSAGLQP